MFTQEPRDTTPSRARPWYRRLYVWVLAGMAAGAITGLVAPDLGDSLQVLGDLFVSLLTMLLGPILFCMVVSGIAAVANLRSVGKVALRSILYFEVVTTVALLLGLVVVDLVEPGSAMHVDPSRLRLSESVAQRAAAGTELDWTDYFTQLVPDNAVAAFAEGHILQILFLSVLIGIAIASMGEQGRAVARATERVSAVLFTVVRFVTYLAPVGVFGAMAYTTGHFGAATLGALVELIATFYLTSLVFVVVVLGGALLLAGLRPLRTFRYFKEEVLLAFGASSSEVAIPGIVRKLENAGVSKGTAGITVSAGYSFNLDGTCIYLTLSTMFIAQALGLHLSFGEQLMLLLVMLLSSKGTAGVTGGGFVMLTTTVSSLSLIPVSGVMLVFGVDRFMSECRAVVNSLGNAVAGLVISRWQGETRARELNAIMGGGAPGLLHDDRRLPVAAPLAEPPDTRDAASPNAGTPRFAESDPRR
ncbi:cation:dicarboxylase symporter family transporter [Nocardia sp. NPDC052254]|uniref:cation:dicarboxylate symporter family transporter n=1 Tax=Nocardia sp. NPDC052254 TaxID=3155681 RepID=UPI00343A822D